MRSIIHFDAPYVDRYVWIVFRQGLAVGLAIHRAVRGKLQSLTTRYTHCIQQAQSASNVGRVIFLRIDHGFADETRCCKVHHRGDLVFGKDARGELTSGTFQSMVLLAGAGTWKAGVVAALVPAGIRNGTSQRIRMYA